MVRTLEKKAFTDGLDYVKLAGLSTDEKPTGGIVTGSEFLEVDTGLKFYYDETDGGSWGDTDNDAK